MRRFLSFLRAAAIALAIVAMPAISSAAPILYGVTFGDQLITINTTTGAGTLVGNLSSNMFAFGLAAINGKLYAYDQQADVLARLNPATGATLSTINLGLSLSGEGGIDFRSDGVGFLNSTAGDISNIYRFTESANSGVFVGNTGNVAGIDGLAFSPADVLYGLGQTPNDNLYIVNQLTGSLTLVGATGVSHGSVGGLDFLGNTLYAAIADSLYTLNPATGAATLIGRIGFDRVSGLAFLDDAQAVPEPASLVLIGSGLVGFIALRRRKV